MKRFGKASAAFGRLTKRLLQNHGIRSTSPPRLPYTEPCGPVHASVLLRDVEHVPPAHPAAGVVPLTTSAEDLQNHEVAGRSVQPPGPGEECGLPSIECLIIKCQLRWTGHIVRMEDDRIPKMRLYGHLKEGHLNQGRPFKRYKDTRKANLKSCNIDVHSWEATACDRALWTYQCTQGTKDFEVNRAAAILAKKERRKQRSASVDSFSCSICGRSCASRNWSSFPYEDPPRQMTCLPTHRSVVSTGESIHTDEAYCAYNTILKMLTLIVFTTPSFNSQ